MMLGRVICFLLFSLQFFECTYAIGQDQDTGGQSNLAGDAAAVEAELPSEVESIKDKLKQAFPDEDDEGLVDEFVKVAEYQKSKAPIKNDAIVFGILTVMLGLIFYTSNIKTGFFGLFYKFIPMLLLCYFCLRC